MIRIRTTGGGGWGDPLERDPALVVRDVRWGKVSPEAALRDYGVVLTGSGRRPGVRRRGHDPRARAAAVSTARRRTGAPFFDRGPGYARLSGGATYADVDVV